MSKEGKQGYYVTLLEWADWMRDRLSSDEKFRGKRFVFFNLFVNKCREALYAFVMCSWDTLVVELVGRGWCVMSESDWLRPQARWLLLTRGPVRGFGALD